MKQNTKVLRHALAAAVLLFLASPSMAQYNNQLFYNNYFKTTASFNMPSELGTDIKRFSLDLPSFQFYAGNTAFSAQDMYDVYYVASADSTKYDEITKAGYILNKIAGNTRERNYIYAGTNVYPLNLAFKVHRKGNELATFGLSTRVVGGGNVLYGGQIFELAKNGNGAFAGEEINLGNFGMNAQAYYEIGFGAAFPIVKIGELVDLRGGFKVKQLIGLSAIQTVQSDVLLNTHPEGRELDFTMDYRVNIAAPLDEGQEITSILNSGLGRGLGFDAGVSGKILDRFRVSLAVNDIGGIRYSGQVRNYSTSENYNWKGLNIDFDSLESALELGLDTFLQEFDLTETNESFRTPLATRLVLNGTFGLGQMSKKGMTFYRHNFHLTYIQGFTNVPGNSTIPFINAAYAFNLANMLTVGANLGYGGSYGFNMGTFLSANLAVVRIGIGTNSLLGLLAPSLSRGADLSLNMAIAF